MKTIKTAVSLPAETYHKAEKLRKRLGKSRSQMIADALAAIIKETENRERDERFIAAYKKHPETDAEVATTQAATEKAWDELFDDDWTEEYNATR
jgi:metal-responsive CopG/Arc/MetJ family transcriptional regulator